jgi:hypothetical protein
MKRKILKFLYDKNEALFADFIVESFFGNIPRDTSVPALDFMANNKNVLERFFSVQAYHLTRKAITSGKHVEFYDGALMIIKALVLAMNRSRITKKNPIVGEKKENPLEGVNKFMEGMDKIKSD